MSMKDEVEIRRTAYYERVLSRIASEVAGNAQFQAERITGIMDEIDGLQQQLTELILRVDRIASFVTQLKRERNGNGTHD
jgi:hypothetical protein